MDANRAQLMQKWVKWGQVFCIALTILGVVLLAAVPPVSRDALTHHLAVPKLYLDKGGIVELPECPYSYYPMNLDLLYLLPLYWGNDILPKYIHFSFGLFTALIIFFFLKRRIGATFGLLGFLLFLSTPIILKLSITVYVDLGLIFFTTAALLAFIRWIETGFRWRDLLISAGCCGLALGTKYNGLIVFFLVALFVPFAYSVKNRGASRAAGPALMRGAVFVLAALLVFSPWMIRNIIWKSNPLYPLYQSIFQTKAPAVVAKSKRAESGKPAVPLNHFSFRAQAYGDTPLEIAMIPVRVFFQGQDNNPKYFDGVLTPYLLLFPLAWVLLARKRALDVKRGEFYLLIFSILYLLFVFVQIDMRIRWISPIIPPLTILSVLGVDMLCRSLKNRLQGPWLYFGTSLVILFLAGILGMHFRYLMTQFEKVAPWPYITRQISRDDYITRYRPAYPVFTYANRTLPETAQILGLFLGNRRYYSQRRLIFDENLFEGAARRSNAAAMANALKAAGITHLMLREDLFTKWIGDNFEPLKLEDIQVFFNAHLALMASHRGYHLYALR